MTLAYRRPPRALALLLLVGAVLAVAHGARAQRATLRGFVTDAADGQRLPGVNVTVEGAGDALYGAPTDADGFYTVAGVPAGRYVFRASFVGYETVTDTLDLAGGVVQRDVAMAAATEELGEAVVTGERTSGAANITAGLQRVRAEDVAAIPAPDVSGDLANYLTAQPGVVTSGDRGGQLFIRGGEPTQNLVLLDGMPVYQPFHVLGFYSAFPTDLLSSADVYAGGYNARFGGQLSSVLDVSSRHGNKRRFGASASVAPFVSGVLLEGPLVPDRLSFLLTGRRSVIEQGAQHLVEQPLPFDFGDAFGKLHFTPGPASQLSVSGLYTFDRGTIGDPDAPRPDEVRYTNAAGGFRYLLLPGSSPTLAEIVLSYALLDSELGPSTPSDTSAFINERRLSRVDRFGAEFNITYFLPRIDIRFGGFLRNTDTSSELGGLFQNVEVNTGNVTEAGLYVEPDFKLGTVLRISPGVRATLSPSLGRQFVEPRFRTVLEVGRHRLSAAAGVYNQPIVGISDRRDATSIFTVWTTAPFGDIPRAYHVLGGYRIRPVEALDFSVEGFYKWLENLSIAEWTAYPRLTTSLQPAEGEAYGVDLRGELRLGGVYASLTYGLSRVEYAATSPTFDLWYGEETLRFRPAHDRRHQVNALLKVPVFGFDISALWQFGSGLPYSRALGFDVFLLPDGIPDVFGEPGDARVLYERPFNGLLPDYHRLDVAVERLFDLGAATLTAQAGVINGYDRRNLFAFDLFTLRRVDQLPFIPTFGLKVAFD
jgi:hypothetical protein